MDGFEDTASAFGSGKPTNCGIIRVSSSEQSPCRPVSEGRGADTSCFAAPYVMKSFYALNPRIWNALINSKFLATPVDKEKHCFRPAKVRITRFEAGFLSPCGSACAPMGVADS